MRIQSISLLGALLSFSTHTLASSEIQDTRELMPEMAGYGKLACNANVSPQIDTEECLDAAIPLSTLLEGSTTLSTPITIPCGSCVTID